MAKTAEHFFFTQHSDYAWQAIRLSEVCLVSITQPGTNSAKGKVHLSNGSKVDISAADAELIEKMLGRKTDRKAISPKKIPASPNTKRSARFSG